MKQNYFLLMCCLSSVAVLSACKSTVSYGDPQAVETVTADWGSTDLQEVAKQMVQSILRSPIVEGEQKPAIAVGSIDNRTDEHIDTKLIMDEITTALVQSGKVRLVSDTSGREEIAEQIALHQSGVVSADTAKVYGKQIGADYVIYGRLANITKSEGNTKDIYFNFNLNVVDVETAIIAWKEKKDIRKSANKSVFGW